MQDLTVEELKTELLKYHKVLTGWLDPNNQKLLFTTFPFEGNNEVKENLKKLVDWLNERYEQVSVEPVVKVQTAKEEIVLSTNKDDNNNFNNHSTICRCLECSDVAFRKLE